MIDNTKPIILFTSIGMINLGLLYYVVDVHGAGVAKISEYSFIFGMVLSLAVALVLVFQEDNDKQKERKQNQKDRGELQ